MSEDIILPTGLPAKEMEALQNAVKDTDKFVQLFFQIKDKSGMIVPFHYNRPQKLHQERSVGSDFDMVLKGRKIGISSRRIARDLTICTTRKHQHRILLTHTGDAADKIMVERVMPLIQNCKFPLNATTRKDHIYFPVTDSRYYIGTAGSKKYGRGDDVTGYHFSEYAHWPGPDVVGGLEQALVENADGLIETTANGHNFFKKDWEAAKKKQNQYRSIFLPWYTDLGYSRDSTLEPGEMSEEEMQIMQAFELDANQISWRRWKKRTMRDPTLFAQEYPETDEQAFLSSGRPVFDWLSLARLRQQVSEPKFRGYLIQQRDRILFEPDKQGELRIWKMPERGHVYAIGSDIAEGLKDGAYSTGEVIDVGDSEQVAEWHGHIAPDLFADILDLLSRFYNQAIIIPESWPGPGEVTTSHLVDKKSKIWKKIDAERPGFETNRQSKPAMIQCLNSALRDFQVTIRSQEMLEELHAFIYDEKMSMGPSLGNFSDRVMGFGIGYYCTRDLAERVDYYRAEKPEFIKQIGSFMSVPIPSGPLPGRRNE